MSDYPSAFTRIYGREVLMEVRLFDGGNSGQIVYKYLDDGILHSAGDVFKDEGGSWEVYPQMYWPSRTPLALVSFLFHNAAILLGAGCLQSDPAAKKTGRNF